MKSRGGPARVLFRAGSFFSLEEALWREMRAARAEEPLAPLVVLVPTNLLRRHLAAEGARRGGLINVHFLTLLDLAGKVGGPALAKAGRAPLPRFGDQVVARAVCQEAGADYFAALARRPGFHRALLDTIEDLKEACCRPADLGRAVEALAESPPGLEAKLRDLEGLWAAYERRLARGRLYDSADLLAAAADAAPRDRWLSRVAWVGLYGFYDLNPLQRRLVAAATGGQPAAVFFPYEPEAPAFAYAEPTFQWFLDEGFVPREEPRPELPAELATLGASLFGPPPDEPRGAGGRVRVVSAPDELREVKTILRTALDAAREGHRLYRVGVVLRQPATYAPLFAEECEAGGLAAYHDRPPPLSASRAGRSMLLLLRLLGSDFPRADLMEFVTYADVPFEDFLPAGAEAAPADWDLASIEAGVVAGRETWLERLGAYRRRLSAEDAGGERRARRLEAVEAFLAFLEGLFEALAEVPQQGTWGEMVDAVLEAYRRLVRPGEGRQATVEAMGALGALDATGEQCELDALASLAREALDSRRPRPRSFGSCGPTIVGLMEGRGLPFDVVCVPGLVEKAFPAPPAPDPLLSDGDRRRLRRAGLELSLQSRRGLEERLLFRLAVGAGSRAVVLTTPRLDPSTGRERVASHFLLRVAEALTGRRADYAGMESLECCRRLASGAAAQTEGERAWRTADYDLAAARAAAGAGRGDEACYLARLAPTFANALRAERERWGRRTFTEYDGVLRSEAARAALARRLGEPPWKLPPTALERYAECPFRFFLQRVLKLEPLEEPERVRRLAGVDRGRLLHDVLYQAVARARSEGRPLSQEDETATLAVAREHFQAFEREGLVGMPGLWELERESLEQDLRRFVLDEATDAGGYVPAHLEVTFGRRPRHGGGEPGLPEGLPFDLGAGRALCLVGRIDRVDVHPATGQARVLDYKAGSRGSAPKRDSLAGGTALQLPIYLCAAQAILGESAQVAEAAYRYVTARGGYRTVGFSRGAYEGRRDDLRAVLATIVEGIARGRFFAAIAGRPCRTCDYRLLCGAAARTAASLKADDEAARDYLAMQEIE
ncbi:MAG: PD-(D/E)XK nuclease family protein [Candidatus Brocadiia bacterium]